MTACYLDNAATTRVIAPAKAAAALCMEEEFGNPSSLHEGGRRAARALKGAREELARILRCKPQELTFVSGGTEAINTALFGAAYKRKHLGRHIVSTEIEHDAVRMSLGRLKEEGFEVSLAKPQPSGEVTLESITSLLREDTILLSLQAVNNETGAVLPYQEAAACLKRISPKALVHVDGVQAFCKSELTLDDIDLLSLSGHKLGALKGVGVLYQKEGLALRPLLYGGGQEGGLRSGTEGMPQILSFAAAASARAEKMAEHYAHALMLKEALLSGLAELKLPYALNSPQGSSPYIINLSLLKGKSEVYLRALSDMGIYVSASSACNKGGQSHVLKAMRLSKANMDAALRISTCPENTADDIGRLLKGLDEAIKLF